MSEVQAMVRLGMRARARGEQLCLVTVVHVEGSAYRKPGARMLLTAGGERAGTISGGCLEAEVSRKAWWLTAGGPRVERYSSFADEDGGMPYGLGCGGVVTLLLEQGAAAQAVLGALEQGLSRQQSSIVVSALEAPEAGTLAVMRVAGRQVESVYARDALIAELTAGLTAWAEAAAQRRQSVALGEDLRPWRGNQGELPAYWVEYLPAAPSLTIFGAGEDAQPIAELAHTLGWRVTVADGRAHLARQERFPAAAEVRVIDYTAFAEAGLRAACGVSGAVPDGGAGADPGAWQAPAPGAYDGLVSDDLAVMVTHSYEQDRALLLALLPRRMRYLGVLGPRHRTERLLREVAPVLGMTVEEGFARLHSPVGLDLGAGEPAAVALAIIAEIQSVLHGRTVHVERATAAANTGDEASAGDEAAAPEECARRKHAGRERAANGRSLAQAGESLLEPADLLG